ncbi:hypothetical protein [Actinomadura meyerae]|jgi:hypothetical protein|uniref:hypothetical protein n=1 Tax=Actinomadura meyerae TaxID=240840 RepID=UPI000B7837DD|nr:hypothetical protein [Actinomadura meyerae]
MSMQRRMVLPPGAPVPDGAVDAGTAPPASRVERLAASGGAVLVTLETDAREPDPGLLAAASVYAWLGAVWFRVPESQADGMRQVLDMVASIEGTRPPAVARRGLA